MKELCLKVLSNSSFLSELAQWDIEEAQRVREKGCPHCAGGVLHRSCYPRSPRGWTFPLLRFNKIRTSFCCNKCRKRATPPSLQFVSRKVFSFVSIILSLLLRTTRDALYTLRTISATIGAHEKTLGRWITWIKEFVKTPEWAILKVGLPVTFCIRHFPFSLFEEFQRSDRSKQAALFLTLKFLSPHLSL